MSHHKTVEATLRITNEGKVLSLWWTNPITGKLEFCDYESYMGIVNL